MMIDIPRLLEAAGGEIIGKVRLQKVVYLLDQMGMNSGFSYEYHHYGPYSAELADRVNEDVIFRKINEIVSRRSSDGVPYSVYRANPQAGVANGNLGGISLSKAQAALAAMQSRTATILELAATIHWLAFVEKVADWRRELVRRKGVKTKSGRDKEALALLSELKLAPKV